MRAYGKKKGHTHVAGHQQCGECHPPQKNKTTRGRVENKEAIAQEIHVANYSISVDVIRSYVIDVEANSPQAAIAEVENMNPDYIDKHGDYIDTHLVADEPELDD